MVAKTALSTLTLVVLTALPLAADETPSRPADDGANVRFTLFVEDSGESAALPGSEVSAVALEGRWARIQSGWRVPFPVTVLATNASGDGPLTTYKYNDVGLAASITGRGVAGGRVHVRGEIELSAVGEPSEDGRGLPVGNFTHDFEVMVSAGQRLTLVEVPQPAGGRLAVALEATLER